MLLNPSIKREHASSEADLRGRVKKLAKPNELMHDPSTQFTKRRTK